MNYLVTWAGDSGTRTLSVLSAIVSGGKIRDLT